MDLTEFTRQAHRGVRTLTGATHDEPDPFGVVAAALRQLWDALAEIMQALIDAINAAARAISSLAESLQHQPRPAFPGIHTTFDRLGRRHHQRGA